MYYLGKEVRTTREVSHLVHYAAWENSTQILLRPGDPKAKSIAQTTKKLLEDKVDISYNPSTGCFKLADAKVELREHSTNGDYESYDIHLDTMPMTVSQRLVIGNVFDIDNAGSFFNFDTLVLRQGGAIQLLDRCDLDEDNNLPRGRYYRIRDLDLLKKTCIQAYLSKFGLNTPCCAKIVDLSNQIYPVVERGVRTRLIPMGEAMSYVI